MDFFTVPMITFRVLYVLIVIHHRRRMLLHVNVTFNPTAWWGSSPSGASRTLTMNGVTIGIRSEWLLLCGRSFGMVVLHFDRECLVIVNVDHIQQEGGRL